MMRAILATTAMFAAGQGWAEAPKVVTDIAPVHSLVSTVLGDLGQPDMIVEPGQSPHNLALRPSQARNLQNADLIVWIGPELTPWLEKPVHSLAGNAIDLRLLAEQATFILGYDDRDLDHDGHNDHDKDHQDHAEEHHDEHEDGHDHAEDDHATKDGHDDHDHHGDDPHAWLDPQNGVIWLGLIAEELGKIDPKNSQTYLANAQAGIEKIQVMQAEAEAMLTPVAKTPFVTFHDAYRYFENRFGLHSAGSVALGDAASPGPARLNELRHQMADLGVSCAFSEPQFDDRLLEAVDPGGAIRIAEIDPLGLRQQLGPDLYTGLMHELAQTVADCLSQ